MTRGSRLILGVNLALLVSSLILGVLANYITGLKETPWYIKPLQSYALPLFLIISVGMVVGQFALHRLENPKPLVRPSWDRNRPPYPGLDPFGRDDAAIFFGREELSAAIVKRLLRHTPAWEDRLLLVVGVSGSGKSSLVQAGILPVLDQSRWLVLPEFSPGDQPVERLAFSIATSLGQPERAAEFAAAMRSDPSVLTQQVAEIRRRSGRRFSHVLLFVDQLEELITLGGAADGSTFLELLEEALRKDTRLTILACARPEFLGELVGSEGSAIFQTPIVIGRIGEEFLASVIEEPARLVGTTFAPGVVKRIVADLGSADALPLMAYMLQQLYFAVGPDAEVTLLDYLATGGVKGALIRQATEVSAEFSTDSDRQPMVSTLLRFVTITGNELAKRPVLVSDLNDEQRRIVARCSDARLLLVRTRDAALVAEVTHEALFRAWPPLRQEIDARLELLRQRSELERWASEWEGSGGSQDYLLTGQRLFLGEQWLSSLVDLDQAPESVRTLVLRSRERDRVFLERVSENVGRHVLANVEHHSDVSILLALAAIEDATPTPISKRALLAALTNGHLRLELQGHTRAVAVRGVAWSPDGRRIATSSRDGSCRIWNAATGENVATISDRGLLESVTWSPDGLRVAIASRDHSVYVWSVDSGEIKDLTDAGDAIRGVAWSPDGKTVAGTSQDKMVHLWRLDPPVHQALAGHVGDVYGVSWNPQNTGLATSSHDRSVIIWDMPSGEMRKHLRGPADIVEAVAWSPATATVASGSADASVHIWDVDTGTTSHVLRSHTDAVWSVAWSPDGAVLASASSDQSIHVHHVALEKRVGEFRGHGGTVWGVAWSPDGQELASTSSDGVGRVWTFHPDGGEVALVDAQWCGVRCAAWAPDEVNVAIGADDGTVQLRPKKIGADAALGYHRDAILAVAWAQNGTRVASCANDGRAVIQDLHGTPPLSLDVGEIVAQHLAWSPDDRRIALAMRDATIGLYDAHTGGLERQLRGHEDWVVHLSWSRSGRWIASCSDDRSARIWDLGPEGASGEVATLRGHDNYVDAVAWSPDERLVVTASADGTLRIWDWRAERQAAVLHGHEGRVERVSWSPDGRYIASGGRDFTVRVWNAETFQELDVVGVHRDRVTSVSWSSDSQRLLTSSMDGTTRVWAAHPDWTEFCERARARVTRALTPQERDAHMLPPPRVPLLPANERVKL